jgi:hypothetical protein
MKSTRARVGLFLSILFCLGRVANVSSGSV